MITTAPKRDNLKVWHAARRPSRVQYVCFWNLKPFCVQPLISWGHTVCVCCLGLRAALHSMTRRSRRPCVTHDRVHCGPKRKSSRSCLHWVPSAVPEANSIRQSENSACVGSKCCTSWFEDCRLKACLLLEMQGQKSFSQLAYQTKFYILKWQRDVAAALHT